MTDSEMNTLALRCTTISTTGPIYAKSSDFYAKLNVSNLNVMNFVLVLVQIDLIHFEHSICISSNWIKTNTNPLVQLQLKLIHKVDTISCKIGHVIQIIPH